ncbi:MAG: hypothetical protein IJT74_00200 [Bacteroidales bacterium]|nr:hypothetical protein [Bacteroidales bacterium]
MKKLTPDQRAGLYITVSIHLAVIIVLLATRISLEVQRENSFVLDFTAQEEVERLRERIRMQERVEAQLEEMLASSQGSVPIRNVTVDQSSVLKDDRGTNADELYKEAERLAKELQDGQQQADDSQDSFASVTEEKKENKKKEEAKPYSGPSVLSWSLDGRKASRLPIPAYRCYGAGEITVVITVNNRGDVVNAKIDEETSSRDDCLRTFAIRAARLSKFSASPEAPARQMGSITYAFIAQ